MASRLRWSGLLFVPRCALHPAQRLVHDRGKPYFSTFNASHVSHAA
jgi:hypothetical protein